MGFTADTGAAAPRTATVTDERTKKAAPSEDGAAFHFAMGFLDCLGRLAFQLPYAVVSVHLV